MKLRIFGLIILLVFCFGIVSAYAEEPKDQMYYIVYPIIEPSMADKFEATVKKFIVEYTKHNLKYPFTAYSSNDFNYYFLIPLNKYADVDDITNAFAEVRNKMGAEKYDALYKGYGGTIKYNRNGFYTHRADLSYFPETPRLKPEEVNFILWLRYYLKTDKVDEAEAVFKEWIALFKSKNIDTGFNTFQGGIGSDMPYMSVSIAGKSALDYFTQDVKFNELMGKEMPNLWKKTFATLNKYEQKMGRPRPDLSYTPKTK